MKHIHTPLFYSLLHPTAQLRPVHRSPFAVASLLFTFSLRYKPMFMLCFHLLCSAFLRVLMIAMIFFPVFSVFCLMGLFIFSFRLVGALQKFSFSGFTCLDLVSVESVGGCCCGWVWVWSVFGLGFYDLCFVFSWCFLCLGLAWVSDRMVFFPLGDFFSSFGVWFFGGFGNFSCWALDFVAMSGFSVLV